MSGNLLPVLAAEDESTDRYILQLAWEDAHIATPLILVKDGEEAVDYLRGAGPYQDRAAYPLPRLITLDLKMPRMNGFNVLEWLGTHPEFKKIPAIVISSSSDNADIQEAKNLGARDYFVKPHRLDDFVAIVRSIQERWLRPPTA